MSDHTMDETLIAGLERLADSFDHYTDPDAHILHGAAKRLRELPAEPSAESVGRTQLLARLNGTDAERLDWLSSKMQVCEVETWRRAGLNPNYATLRDAIDAARAEEEAR